MPLIEVDELERSVLPPLPFGGNVFECCDCGDIIGLIAPFDGVGGGGIVIAGFAIAKPEAAIALAKPVVFLCLEPTEERRHGFFELLERLREVWLVSASWPRYGRVALEGGDAESGPLPMMPVALLLPLAKLSFVDSLMDADEGRLSACSILGDSTMDSICVVGARVERDWAVSVADETFTLL